ncbi:MAG: hypothetical protein KDK36_21945 [Leptospiraceae bacterium]|nr:hypothetical protein [Leptospiraceae bacterium]
MDITAAILRNSAENLIKTKDRVEKKDSSLDSKNSQNTKDTVSFSSHLTGRYILLQNQLSSLQNQYTREQTRLSLLTNNSVNDEELVNILYGGTPLFTESVDEMINERQNLLERIRAQKEQIEDQIRFLEIESENIFSVSHKGSLKDIPRANVSADAIKPLDVKVVEKLIRG